MPGFELATLLPFLTLGALGAAHCVGMCGGFAIAVSASAGERRGAQLRAQLAYVLGKALTYAVLGLGVALLGRAALQGGARLAGDGGADLAALRQGLAWVAGLLMIGLGVVALRGRAAPAPRLERWGALGRGLRAAGHELRRAFQAARALPGDLGALATGLATGLLPCGWSWGALALAATVSPLEALAGLFLFGLATGPALVLVGLGWSGLSARFRGVAARAAGPLLIVFGLFTALRGAELVGATQAQEALLPDCCAAGAEDEHALHAER